MICIIYRHDNLVDTLRIIFQVREELFIDILFDENHSFFFLQSTISILIQFVESSPKYLELPLLIGFFHRVYLLLFSQLWFLLSDIDFFLAPLLHIGSHICLYCVLHLHGLLSYGLLLKVVIFNIEFASAT